MRYNETPKLMRYMTSNTQSAASNGSRMRTSGMGLNFIGPHPLGRAFARPQKPIAMPIPSTIALATRAEEALTVSAASSSIRVRELHHGLSRSFTTGQSIGYVS